MIRKVIAIKFHTSRATREWLHINMSPTQVTNRQAVREMSTSKTAGGSNGYMHVLNKDSINQNLLKAEYAVRGELAIRSEQLREVCFLSLAVNVIYRS